MSSETGESSDTEEVLENNGIYQDAVEEFQEQLPQMREGDYLIGGNLREDFKPFVYSGFVSEFPVNGESVFIVTERGEHVSEGYSHPEEVINREMEVSRDEAYEVFNARTDNFAQAIIAEELLTQYRQNTEQEVKHREGDSWQNYLEFGTEMLENWKQTYHEASTSEDQKLQAYAEKLGAKVEQLTEEITQLSRERETEYIEPLRNTMYEMEKLTDDIKKN